MKPATCSFILFMLPVLMSLQAARVENPSVLIQPADSTVLLEPVSVEAYQVSGPLRSIPGSLSVITGMNISPADGISLATTLNTLPGVTMQSGTYSTNRIVIRGMGSRTPYNTNRIRAYLNDIPLTSSDGLSAPEDIDLQSLGRMEVIKGPSSALYGSGLGGSINLFTPVKMQNEVITGIQYGSYNTGKIGVSGTLHKAKYDLWTSLSHLQSDGYRENNHYRRTTFLSAATLDRTKWSLNYTLLVLGVNGGIPSSLGKTLFETDPQAAASNWKSIHGFKKYGKGVAGITIKNKLSDRFTNRLTVFGKWNENVEKRPFNTLDDRSLGAGLRNRLNYHTRMTDWVIGTEWITEQYDWKLCKDEVLQNKNRENRYQLNVFTMLYLRPTPKLNISLAVALNQVTYRLTDRFTANGDQSGERKFPWIVSPRIGLNYTPGTNWAIYASAGHGYSMPSPEETLLPEGDVNPGIRPEQGMQYEAGTRLNLFGERFGLDGTVYWIELNNLLVTKRITEDIFTGMNAGKTRHQGFELLVQSQMFRYSQFPGQLESSFSYARSLNRFIDFTDNDNTYDGNKLPGIPDQSLNMKFSWDPFSTLSLVTDLLYTGDQYLNDSNSLDYSGYFIGYLKVTAQIQIRKSGMFIFYAGINNFTNTRYASMLVANALGFDNSEPRYYYPGLPRHFYGGIQFRF